MVYKQTESFTCGPSAFMESFCVIKTKRKELELHEKGRIKPSRIFMGISFLELKHSLHLYIENTDVTNGLMRLVFNPDFKNFKKLFNSYYNGLIHKYSHKINIITRIDDVIAILRQAAKKKKKAVVLVHSSYWLKKGTLHWVSFSGLNKEEEFMVGDPRTGKHLHWTEDDLKRTLKKVEQADFPLQVVTNFEYNAFTGD